MIRSISRNMALKNLSSLSRTDFHSFLDSFDTVLTDCDGVIWIGNNIIKGAPDVMNKFKDIGKKLFYVTNNSTKTRDEFVDKFKQLGFNATRDDVICTSYLTATYLKSLNFKKKVYVVGSSGISKELDNVGIKHIGVGVFYKEFFSAILASDDEKSDVELGHMPTLSVEVLQPDPLTSNVQSLVENVKLDADVGAVVVGFDEHFSLPKMLKAATYLEQKESLFIATNTDERFPLGENVIMPGTGSFVAAIQTCSERIPFIVGKPETYIREFLINSHKINPKRTLMIGDRCNTDILLGTRCGFQTLLVLTGVTKLEEVTAWKASSDKELNALVPDYFTQGIGDLLNFD